MQSHRIRRVFDPNEVNTQLVASVAGSHDAFAAARAQAEKSRRDFFDSRENRDFRHMMRSNSARFI